MKLKKTLRSLILTGLLFGFSGITNASESDPWTYAYIPLADSASLINDRLKNLIQTVIYQTNSSYSKVALAGDTELEFKFFTKFRSNHIRDVAWEVFERCIGTNNCPGWPQFMINSGFRRVSILFGFNPLKPGKFQDRKPIVIQRVQK